MKVHEIMTAHARCVAPDNSLVEAAGLMRELDVGALPICDNERLAGMVTDRDLVVRGIADGKDLYNTTVRDVMSPGVVFVFADQDVEEAARMMEEKQIRRLPVLNREKRLVGIVSLGDVAVSSNPAFSGMALKEVSEPGSDNAQNHASPDMVRRMHTATRAPRSGRSSRGGGETANRSRTSASRLKKSTHHSKQSSSRKRSAGRSSSRSSRAKASPSRGRKASGKKG